MRRVILVGMLLLVLVGSPLLAQDSGVTAQANSNVVPSLITPDLPIKMYLPVIHKTVTGGEMVLVMGGNFYRGCDSNNNVDYQCWGDDELYQVWVDSFWMDKFEVTNIQYARCVATGACTPPAETSSHTREVYYSNPDYAYYPVVWVSWYDAKNYCTWAGKRLPTEAEWEKAARGAADTRPFPWGNSIPTCGMANFYLETTCFPGDTTMVGSYPESVSPYGAQDMAGNVWEWVSDWYQLEYYNDPSSLVNPTGPITGDVKVRRGGAYFNYFYDLRVSFREVLIPEGNYNDLGFRCAKSP